MMRYAILVAGGTGNRMNSDVPKQFLVFKRKPVLMHTIERFFSFDPSIKIILVLPEHSIADWENLVKKYPLPCLVSIATGGRARSDSTRSGLALVPDNVLVAIHDAVRPLLSIELIARCFDTAEKLGNACPAIAPVDSLRKKELKGSKSVDRNHFFQVQTPQCFHSKLIKEAFQKTTDNTFTDEISLLESTGHQINLVEGERWNIKITYPEDLIVAEALIANGANK